ncbi:hypothetical protein ANANG_G00156240 [Anguilla anguilla]|uniref:Protein kinase domain-containing protein n=1 Tax=Anguilla anguilla TaxID=7936 RepID=A0A9D3RYI5_ANGAN|nr:hypothetical protein ANANG_G00156240 [Anguilla anguilla]
MGADISKNNKEQPPSEEGRCASGWRGFLSSVGISVSSGLCRLGARRMIREKGAPLPDDHVFQSIPGPERLRMEWSLPGFISMFLPEFPHRNVPGHEHFQVLGCIAKGSFGPILKVKDRSKQKTYAVKVIPKSEVLRQGVLEQSKEEVIIQPRIPLAPSHLPSCVLASILSVDATRKGSLPPLPKAALSDPRHSPASPVTPVITPDTPCWGDGQAADLLPCSQKQRTEMRGCSRVVVAL